MFQRPNKEIKQNKNIGKGQRAPLMSQKSNDTKKQVKITKHSIVVRELPLESDESNKKKETFPTKADSRNSKQVTPDSSSEVGNEPKVKEDLKDREETEQTTQTMSEILDEEEKLLFSLKVLGGIQKGEKLTQKNCLLTVDDRWIFQGLRRWYWDDNRDKSLDKVFCVVSESCKEVDNLLDADYLGKLENKVNRFTDVETTEEKKKREQREDRKQLLQRFFLGLSNAKTGVENLRETYADSFSQAKLNLILDKLNIVLGKLKTQD